MINITKAMVQNNYNKLKRMTQKALLRNDIEKAAEYLKAASKLMYLFNVIYVDSELEGMLLQLSNSIFANRKSKVKRNKQTDSDERRIVFYDWFALDNRGLTMIYLRALIGLGYQVLYITYQKNKPSNMRWIMDTIQSSENIKIYKVRNTETLKAAEELHVIIQDFSPQKALLHTMPNDVVGLAVFASFKGVFDRYMVNITDHAFWLGTSVIDYSIEFRSYGYNVSLKYRNIAENKIMILPYYPAQYYETKFQGFPFDSNGKRIIFSGGALYKIRGSRLFFKTVKHILDRYEDTIFLYAGYGDSTDLNNFITSNKYEDRMYFIGERKDLSQIMKRCYFYLSTYPISGGLMAQYAVVNGKMPITLGINIQSMNRIESVFINTGDINFTYTDIKQFISEIDHIMMDRDYLANQEFKLKDKIISKELFAFELERCLTEYKTSFEKEKFEIDTDEVCKSYFINPNIKEFAALFSELKIKGALLRFPFEYLLNYYYKINSRK